MTGISPERIIELDKYRRPGRNALATKDGHQEWLAAYFADLPADSPLAAERAADHHWNESHPNYDPSCTCGDASSPEERARILRQASEVTEFDGDDSWQVRRAKNEGRQRRRPMSPGQKGYLEGLARYTLDVHLIAELRALIDNPATTWAEASAMIDRVKQAQAMSVRPNRFAQQCKICGQTVEAEQGHLSRDDYGRWLVEHVGTCPEPVDEPETIPVEVPVLDLTPLPAGRYAIPGGDSRLKVMVDKPTTGNWEGYTFVKDAAVYGAGKRYGRQTPFSLYDGEIQDQLRTIMADPRAAMAEYGHITSTCGNCGRALEDETSVEIGIGPTCRKMLGWDE